MIRNQIKLALRGIVKRTATDVETLRSTVDIRYFDKPPPEDISQWKWRNGNRVVTEW